MLIMYNYNTFDWVKLLKVSACELGDNVMFASVKP